jgi:hypothetical protein
MPHVGPHGAFGYFYADESNDCFFMLREVHGEGQNHFFEMSAPRRTLQRTVHKLKLAHGVLEKLRKGQVGLDLVRPREEAAAGGRPEGQGGGGVETPLAQPQLSLPRAQQQGSWQVPS